jgi:hypothetical protein
MYKTKLTVEIDVKTQFGPEDAVNLVGAMLSSIPAMSSAIVVKLETDYVSLLDKGFPEDRQSLGMLNIPRKIK